MPTGYDVQYTRVSPRHITDQTPGNNPGSGWVQVERSGTETSQTITGLKNGIMHYVRVRATNRYPQNGVLVPGASGWVSVMGRPDAAAAPPPNYCAQPRRGTDVVWRTTMTVGSRTSGDVTLKGFRSTSGTGTLTSNSFSLGGHDLTVATLTFQNHSSVPSRDNLLVFSLMDRTSLGSSDPLLPLVLQVGDRAFYFADSVPQLGSARWSNAGLTWADGDEVEVVLRAPFAALSWMVVHFDGDPPLDNFRQWRPAGPASYGYRAKIPGQVTSQDGRAPLTPTTHAKFKVGTHPGNTIRVSRITYSATDDSDATATPPVVCTPTPSGANYECVAYRAVTPGQLSHAIELNAHSPNTGVYIEITDGSLVKRYFLDIDPPARTYSLSASASVVEGQDARLTLSLSEPAPAGGAEFTVTAGRGTAGADDLGAIASPVTVSGGSSSLSIAVPTVDDDRYEGDESFTVTVAPAGFGWGVDPLGTETATVTIEDNDDSEGNYADLIAKVKEWRDDPCCVHNQDHTGRWDRVLLAFGETVADTSLEPMTAAAAQTYADRGWIRWVEVTAALRELENRNSAPTVSSAIADAVIVSESGTHQVSLSGVFSDADSDALTITAASSDSSKATVSVASDYSTLTVSAQARGAAEITVTANNGNGGTVSDTFTVTVKAAPVVASAISDLSLEVDATQGVSLSGVFSDPDNDALTITAASSDGNTAAVTLAADRSRLTVAGIAEGTATITVTAQDADGNRVSDAFTVAVEAEEQGASDGAPTVAAPLADLSLDGPEMREISLSGVFHHPDGDDLTLSWVSSHYHIATGWLDGLTLTVVGSGTGTATITVTAEDPDSNTVSGIFEVTVRPAS